MNGARKEALRQQLLLRTLLGDTRPAVLAGWLRDGPRLQRGLAAYRANAGALAERALSAAFPTLQQLLGDGSFAGLARAFWHEQPPVDGDIGVWGAALPAFVADAESLADEPYLGDVARLEWALHTAERAADASVPQGLQALADTDPALLFVQLAPGTALVVSAFPIVTIWQAHRSRAEDRFGAVRAAFAAAAHETALVARRGWQASAQAIAVDEARFTAALLAGRPLAEALTEAGDGFAFAAWLVTALQQQRLVAVTTAPTLASRR